MALMGATPFTQDMEIWIYHCQHRSMTSTSRLDLCHLSTPSCFRQLFQQHIMLPLCLHLGRNHLVQGFLHSLLLLKNHRMFVLIQTNEAEGWERFQTQGEICCVAYRGTMHSKGLVIHISDILPDPGRTSETWGLGKASWQVLC